MEFMTTGGLVTECRLCPELVALRKQVVPLEIVNPLNWSDPTLPIIMFVARNPGQTEDKVGRPPVGRAGQVQRKIVEPILPHARVVFNNVVKCWTPKDREPSEVELSNCRPWINQEIEDMRPNIVVLLGLTAQKYKFANKEDRGAMRWDGRTLWTATFHPSYVSRGNKLAEDEMRGTIWKAYFAWVEGCSGLKQ